MGVSMTCEACGVYLLNGPHITTVDHPMLGPRRLRLCINCSDRLGGWLWAALERLEQPREVMAK
jgi:hypothetical protein